MPTPPDAANAHDALRGLAKWLLERDDVSDPGGRIYRDGAGEIYHSVTRILKETSNSKAALEAWVARLGVELAAVERDTAATRGTLTHNAAEYVLRSAKKLAIGAAKFAFFVRSNGPGANPNASAWLQSLGDNSRVIDTHGKGVSAVATGTSARGTRTSDTYSLAGFADAMAKVHDTCKM